MSASLSHPSSCLLILFLLFSDHPFAAGTSIPDINRARRAKHAIEFLHAHNRARVSSGVPPLKWNRGLRQFASKWAKQRKPDCNMMHSDGPYGENIFWYKTKRTWSPANVVERWFEERLNYDSKANTCAQGEMCGHYTQIVWRGTTAVGCARVRCNKGLGYLVVCEYDPRGNYEGESPFDHGVTGNVTA